MKLKRKHYWKARIKDDELAVLIAAINHYDLEQSSRAKDTTLPVLDRKISADISALLSNIRKALN